MHSHEMAAVEAIEQTPRDGETPKTRFDLRSIRIERLLETLWPSTLQERSRRPRERRRRSASPPHAELAAFYFSDERRPRCRISTQTSLKQLPEGRLRSDRCDDARQGTA
jgi:hypothetical protein